MKKIKALVGFAGVVTLAAGQTADVTDEAAADLLKAGFAEEVAEEKAAPKKKGGAKK